MSHVGNKLKSGFFAFPERQGKELIQLLHQEGNTASWLDPTCGEGAILHQLSQSLQSDECAIATFGVEIDKTRYELANQKLTQTVHASIESMVISNDAFSLIFLNPPYDYTVKGMDDGKAQRKEFIELQRNTRYLKPGGIMVYVIPSYRFSDKNISRFLATHFEDTAIMRFTDADYDAFRQCVFIGRKKKGAVKRTNPEEMQFYQNMYDEAFILDYVAPIDSFIGEQLWLIPSSPLQIKTFYTKVESKEKFYEGIQASSGFQAFKNRIKPRTLQTGGDPILPIGAGQMALLLASGAINGLLGNGKTLHLVQGQEIVSTEVEEEEMISDSGAKTTKRTEKTKRNVSVKMVTPKGIVKKLV